MVQIARFPRHILGHFPTPLERMENLERRLRQTYAQVPRLWIKRDDCTGLATGGNKTRKLEFLVADAEAQGADTLITQGAVQSNHARQTAAAAAVVGMGCELLLEQRQQRDVDYDESGNVLLEKLLGARIKGRLPAGTDMQAAMEELADDLRAAGRRPYVIPGGGSNPIGALGYAQCAAELETAPIPVDWVVHTTGSCGTQAGLVAGFQAFHSEAKVLGISNRRKQDQQVPAVRALTERTASLLGTGDTISPDCIRVDDRFIGGGYGEPTDEMISAIRLLARTEGILLDPVYTGKGFAGLLGNIADGTFDAQENVVFVHTGGTAGLFGYRSVFDQD